MRRSLIVISIVVLALLGAEIALRLAAPALPEPTEWYSGWAEEKAGILRTRDVPPEVVFLGDSSTMNGLDPHQFAEGAPCYQDVFNAAIPALDFERIEDWYARVVAPASDPSLVIIGMTSLTVTIEDPAPYFQAVAVREGWLGSVSRWFNDISWLVRYRGVIRDPVELARHFRGEPSESWDELDASGWFSPPDRAYSPPEVDDTSPATFSSEDRKAMVSLIENIRGDGARPVLVWMPETSDREATFDGGATSIARVREAVEGLAAEQSIPFVDLTTISSTRNFTDSLHLDPGGSRLAGRLLLQELEQHPDLGLCHD